MTVIQKPSVAKAQSPWRLIETAPRDGTLIDVWVLDGYSAENSVAGPHRVTDAYWGKRSSVYVDQGLGWCEEADDGWAHPIEPTHWMPRPPPPKVPT